MATAKQIAANRKNAKKSLGPVTPEGKATVSQNALKHGFFGTFRVLQGESQQKFDNMLEQLVLDQKPVGALETDLVRQMAQHLWLKDRASRYQEACFLPLGQTPEQKANNQMEMGITVDLERFAWFESHHDRLFHRTLNALLKLRKEREKAEIGFDRRKRAEAEEKRREKHEIQRDNIYEVRYATAQLNKQLTEIKVLKAIDPFGPPDFAQAAA